MRKLKLKEVTAYSQNTAGLGFKCKSPDIQSQALSSALPHWNQRLVPFHPQEAFLSESCLRRQNKAGCLVRDQGIHTLRPWKSKPTKWSPVSLENPLDTFTNGSSSEHYLKKKTITFVIKNQLCVCGGVYTHILRKRAREFIYLF